MAQYQKDEVRERIVEAALAVLAERGFAGASIAEIARRAGVATGNVYRYFPGKEALFEAAVPESFVASMRAVLRKRVRALAGVVDASGPPSPAFAAATADLFTFLLEHRLRIVVALGRAEGTRWDGLRDELVDELVTLAIAHFRELDPALRVTEARRAALHAVYRNLTAATVALLLRFADGAKLRAALEDYTRYHLAGLPALFR